MPVDGRAKKEAAPASLSGLLATRAHERLVRRLVAPSRGWGSRRGAPSGVTECWECPMCMSNVPVGCACRTCQLDAPAARCTDGCCQDTTASANAATEPKPTPTTEPESMQLQRQPRPCTVLQPLTRGSPAANAQPRRSTRKRQGQPGPSLHLATRKRPAVATDDDQYFENSDDDQYFVPGEVVKCWECEKLCAAADQENVTHLVCLNKECAVTFSPNECDREDEPHGHGRGRTNLEAWMREGILGALSSDDELDYSEDEAEADGDTVTTEAQEHQNQPASSAPSMYPNVSRWSSGRNIGWRYQIYNSNWTPQRRQGNGFATDLLAYQAYVAVCVKEGMTPKTVKRALRRARTGDTPWDRDISGAC